MGTKIITWTLLQERVSSEFSLPPIINLTNWLAWRNICDMIGLGKNHLCTTWVNLLLDDLFNVSFVQLNYQSSHSFNFPTFRPSFVFQCWRLKNPPCENRRKMWQIRLQIFKNSKLLLDYTAALTSDQFSKVVSQFCSIKKELTWTNATNFMLE